MSVARSSTATALSSTCATRLQVVERGGLAAACLLEPELRALVGAVDAVEELGDRLAVSVGVLHGASKQRLGESVLLGLNALSKAREHLSVLFVEGQAQSARVSHAPNRTASGDAVSKPC